MISCVCTSVVGEVPSRSRFSTVTRADLLRRTVPLDTIVAVVRVLRLSRSDLGHGPKRRRLVVARVTPWLCDVC